MIQETQATWGGKRSGSGRRPCFFRYLPVSRHTVSLSLAVWRAVRTLAHASVPYSPSDVIEAALRAYPPIVALLAEDEPTA